MSEVALELEHAIGYSGKIPGSIHYHPNRKDYIYVSGGCVITRDLIDPHTQVFLRGHDTSISCFAMSKSGRFLASGQFGQNSDVCVWDWENKDLLYRLTEHEHGIKSVAFSHDEKLLATVGDTRLIIWDMSNGYIVSSASMGNAHQQNVIVTWGGFKKDIKRRETTDYFLAMTINHQVRFLTLNPHKGELSEDKVSIPLMRQYNTLTFSSDAEYLYAGTTTGDFFAIRTKTAQVAATVQAQTSVLTIRVVDQGRYLLVGGADGTLSLYATEERNYICERRISLRGGITSISVSADETELLVGTNMGFVYRVNRSDLRASLLCENHEEGVTALAFPRDISDKFATCSMDGSIRYWDVSDYKVIAQCSVKAQHHPLSMCFLNDIILTGWSDGSVKTFDPVTNKLIWTKDAAHRGAISVIKSSNSGRFFITGGKDDGEIRLWDIRTRELVSHSREHSSTVTGLCIFDDDGHVLTCGRDRNIFCIDLRRERKISTHIPRMGSVNGIALFKNQTQFLSVGTDKKITYWSLRGPDPLRSIQYSTTADPTTVCLSNDNRFFAVGGTDEVVKLYSTDSGQLLAEGVGHSGVITKLQFSPDDKQLVSVGMDSSVLVWNVYA